MRPKDGVKEGEGESEELLGFLQEHMEQPRFRCRFRWRPHSVAIWDNRLTQHRPVRRPSRKILCRYPTLSLLMCRTILYL